MSLIKKSLNEDKRLATFLVLEPQNDDMTTTDLHLDWYSAEDVESACHNFNRFCRKSSILHAYETTAFEFVESYLTLSDMTLGDQEIKKGSWLATIFVSDEALWPMVKDGTFDGLSVQCMAEVSPV